jgi:hypothetical protein
MTIKSSQIHNRSYYLSIYEAMWRPGGDCVFPSNPLSGGHSPYSLFHYWRISDLTTSGKVQKTGRPVATPDEKGLSRLAIGDPTIRPEFKNFRVAEIYRFIPVLPKP